MRTALLSIVIAAGSIGFVLAGRANETSTSRPAATSRPSSRPGSSKLSDKRVIIETSLGNITIELTPDKTPGTVKNFLSYVDEKYYDNTIFHRVIKDFMIQGGGFAPEAQSQLDEKKTHSPIKNEVATAIRNKRGTISMARKGPDPRDPDKERAIQNALASATSQFFINHRDNGLLDFDGPYGGYAAFGRVVEGMDVVDKIASVEIGEGPLSPAQPKRTVVIKSIRRAPAE